jgi:RNA polymerase sigma-70 factor (ECF subfamily)
MYRFALSLVRQSDEAEDVVQDISLKLWERSMGITDNIRSVEAYAMKAVKNRCLDYLRRQPGKLEELTESVRIDPTPLQSLEQADMAAFVRKLIEKLPLQQQMIIRLRDVEEYELDEIADILDMNEGAVRTGLSRARRKIREQLTIHHEW